MVKDFNTGSLHKKIEPLIMRLQYDEWPGFCLNVRYSGSETEVIASIKKVYETVLPGFLVDYGRVDERYESQYATETKAFGTLQMATWIILVISCIGIFSMSLFLSLKRQKEFGIRKIVGASVEQIMFLQIEQFFKLLVIANILTLPLTYWLMKEWLDDFAYKTELSSWVFLGVTVVSLLLVVISAGYSSWKAGQMNPVDVLKIQ